MLTQYQLKNKMKVLLVESQKAPVVAVQVWVRTGSADERKKQEGISHFIEHLVFKGTKKFGVGEIAKQIEGSGGELNAYTTFDHTVFHVTMSKKDLELGLECLSEMMGFPKFDAAEIDREREVVIEEIKRSFDNPHQVASQQLFSTLFKKHPYGIPIIGYEKNIREVSRKKLLEYYHARYVPSNMTLVVTGSFDKSEIKKLISKHYEIFEKNKLKKVKRAKDPKQKQLVYSYRQTDFKEAHLNIAFKAPGLGHKDVAALDMLGMVLGQGDSSRMVNRLRLQKPLVVSVGVGGYHPVDQGLFAAFVNLKAENLRETFSILQEELVRINTELVSEEELERAKLNTQSDEVYGLETVDGLARKVGSFQTLLGEPEYLQKYLKQVQTLTSAELLKVARKYLTPKNLTATLMINKADEPSFTQKEFFELSKKLEKALGAAIKLKIKFKKVKMVKSPVIKVPLKLKSGESLIKKHQFPNGARVIWKKNPEVPVMSVKLGFLGGGRYETDENSGVTTLVSNTWTAGTTNLTEDQIAASFENAASHISSFGGRNTLGLSLDCLKVYFNQIKDVYADVVLNPRFNQEVVNREAQMQIHHIKSRVDNPAGLTSQKFMELIFQGHPYSRDPLGKESFLTKATQDDAKKFFEFTKNSKNAVFVVTGDFDEDKVLAHLEKISSQMNKGPRLDKRFEMPALTESKQHFSVLQKEQTHIVWGYRGISLTDKRRFALDIIQAILAGQGGRLFLELRDKASLAYTVSPIHLNGVESGYFGAYIGCSPEKGTKSVQMLKDEFQKMVQSAPSDLEVDRAKKYLIGQNHIGLQRNGAQANSILFDEIYGIDSEEAFRYADFVEKITADEILKLARELFTQPSVSVAFGAKNPWPSTNVGKSQPIAEA